MLHFGARPPFALERFLQLCQGQIPEKDLGILKTIFPDREYAWEGSQSTLQKWYAFETRLRNELVKIRASRKHSEPSRYLRREGYAEPSVVHIAMSAYRNPSILEAERMLDEERWRVLEELAIGHYFDIDFLIVYACKLMILERWEKIRSADKARLLQETISMPEA